MDPYWGKGPLASAAADPVPISAPAPAAAVEDVRDPWLSCYVEAGASGAIEPVATLAANAGQPSAPVAFLAPARDPVTGLHPDDASALDALVKLLQPSSERPFRDDLLAALSGAGVSGDGASRALAASDGALGAVASWADQANPALAAQLRAGMAILGAVRAVLA